jgi:hypothetical protein
MATAAARQPRPLPEASQLRSLVDLNGTVDLADEPEAGPETDTAREEKEREGDDEHVAEVYGR